jgi:F420H(2)-dependent quinone reductase
MRVEHDGSYLAVGSKGGAPENPVWVKNLRTHPEAEVWDGPQKGDFSVRELAGEERSEWWGHAVEAYPDYADYQERTDREIPLFLLEPTSQS